MKKYIIATALALSIFQVVNAQVASPTSRHQISATSLRQLDSLYHYLDSTGLYNGNILVGVGGKKVSAASIGYSNLRTKERLTEASPFNLASVSKQFTAVGILRLVQAGKITLDQQVTSILPGFPYKGVTVRHLLNHTSGLPDYQEMLDKHWDKTKIATNKDMLKVLTEQHPELLFAPGTKWQYSNTGYALLASVIETTSHKSFGDYMREQVFLPFGLHHTFVYTSRYAPRPIKGYAYSYVKKEAGVYVEPDSIPELDFVRYVDGVCGQGRVHSTTTDLLTWNNAIRDQKVLSKALWEEATTAPEINGKNTGYGFGLEVVQNPERGRVLMHTGSWPAYITKNALYLDKDVSLIYLTNKEQESDIYEATFEAVKNIVFGKPFSFPTPLVQTEAAIDTAVYRYYVGTYTIAEMAGFELTVSTKDGKLYLDATGQPQTVITPESETMFFIPGEPVKLEFKANNGAMATALILHQNGAHEFKRK